MNNPVSKFGIKGLQSQIKQLKADITLMKGQVSQTQREMALKSRRVTQLEQELNKLQGSGEIKVTEHALLRYLERIKGIDMDAIRDEIVNDTIKGLHSKLGPSGKYPCDNFRAVMKNNTIITIEEV